MNIFGNRSIAHARAVLSPYMFVLFLSYIVMECYTLPPIPTLLVLRQLTSMNVIT